MTHCVISAAALLLAAAPLAAQELDAGAAPPGSAPLDPAADPVVPPPVAGEVKLEQAFEVRGPASEEPPRDPVETSVGTELVLTLQVTHPANTTVALPDEQPVGRFELLRAERDPLPPGQAAANNASVTETIRLVYAIYRPGRHVLAPFDLRVLDAEGHITPLRTRPVEVIVRSVIANEADPKMPAVRPPRTIEVEDWSIVWILSVVLGIGLAAAIGALLYRALAPRPVPPPPPPRPAWEVAIEKLLAIKHADLISQELYEEFYVRVSEAIREYLGRRYNLSLTDKAGLELTTWELARSLRDIHWPRGIARQEVEDLLVECDMVKFARYAPTHDEANDILTRAFRLVELTRPTELGAAALAASDTPPRAPTPTSTP